MDKCAELCRRNIREPKSTALYRVHGIPVTTLIGTPTTILQEPIRETLSKYRHHSQRAEYNLYRILSWLTLKGCTEVNLHNISLQMTLDCTAVYNPHKEAHRRCMPRPFSI